MMSCISVTMTDGIADVRLTRPEKMNALDPAMFAALVETGEHLKRDPSVRAIVLSGEGRAFCAGLDTENFGRMASGAGGLRRDLIARSHGIANAAQYAVWVWHEMPVPVIAAVHGIAFGGGFQLTLGPDLRYVAPDTKLSVMEIKWGLVPDMAGTQLLRHLVRDDVARELTYTGRIFTGMEAHALGIATRVTTDPHGEAMATAREIAGKNPAAIRAAKRLLNMAPVSDPAAGLMAESAEQLALIGSPNQVEAVMANLEKRAPRFSEQNR
jgi:enoyl-CoA hydratase/carnithine racemase